MLRLLRSTARRSPLEAFAAVRSKSLAVSTDVYWTSLDCWGRCKLQCLFYHSHKLSFISFFLIHSFVFLSLGSAPDRARGPVCKIHWHDGWGDYHGGSEGAWCFTSVWVRYLTIFFVFVFFVFFFATLEGIWLTDILQLAFYASPCFQTTGSCLGCFLFIYICALFPFYFSVFTPHLFLSFLFSPYSFSSFLGQQLPRRCHSACVWHTLPIRRIQLYVAETRTGRYS